MDEDMNMASGTVPREAHEAEITRLRKELEIAYQKLAEAHKMASIGRLVSGVVHEINTPIGSILSNNDVSVRSLEAMKRLLTAAKTSSAAPPDKAMDILETVISLASVDKIACERIGSVVRSLRTFSRVDEGDFRKAQVHEILENTIKLANTVFRRRVTIERDYGDIPEIDCHPQLLNQVFLNLLVNAAQAIEGEGIVRVSTRVEGDSIVVSITDSGKGIRPEDRHKIFRAGYTTKPASEGTGLGLSITRDIVVATHGGSIDFDSEPGAGATFHVRIPISQSRTHGK